MANLLHDYLADLLSPQLAERRVVVWYDPRREFDAFVAEVDGEELEPGLRRCTINGVQTVVASYDGSLYSVRHRVEPLVASDTPEPLVIHLSGLERDQPSSVLLELELAGTPWEPQLRQLARLALRQRFTDGVVDGLLRSDVLDYPSLAAASERSGDAPPSVLRTVLTESSPDDQLSHWLAVPELDATITEKLAADELALLVSARLGIELPEGHLAKWRSITVRYVLGVEFRSDMKGEPPAEVASLAPSSADVQRSARRIASTLRSKYPACYSALSDAAAAELKLDERSVDPLLLGSIDTFAFEEQALLGRCADLMGHDRYQDVLDIAAGRVDSFWLSEQIERRSQWEAIRRAAELGTAAEAVAADLAKPPSAIGGWVAAYADRWHRLDRTQRELEAWLPKLEDDPDEEAIARVRQRYDDVLATLATGFVKALEASGWTTEGELQQTSVYDDIVRGTTGRVAYFLVDAMRYEMGADLAERLESHGEVRIRPAIGVLPSITPTGMAALMPGASSSYSVADQEGKLLALVDGAPLADLQARKKHLAARVPGSVDLELAEVNSRSQARLTTKIGKASLVVVRSQEIDSFGEGGFQARPVMDTVVDNLAQAVRKLAGIGIEHAVLVSDHGHLYASADRDESMRIDAPQGETVLLHRRCWVGRGGATPAATIRVGARSLGNDTDLDFVFPRGIGVFRAGGDLAFHHGGASPQEMIVPVVTVRSSSAAPLAAGGRSVSLAIADVPTTITNRIFSIKIALDSLLGAGIPIKPVLLSAGRQVGTVGIVHGAELDRATSTVALTGQDEATVAFVLDDDTVATVDVVVLDPMTDAELYRSPPIPVQLGVS